MLSMSYIQKYTHQYQSHCPKIQSVAVPKPNKVFVLMKKWTMQRVSVEKSVVKSVELKMIVDSLGWGEYRYILLHACRVQANCNCNPVQSHNMENGELKNPDQQPKPSAS